MLSSARPTPACRPPPPARHFRFPAPPPPPTATPHVAPPPPATPHIPPAAPTTAPPAAAAACRRAWLTWRRRRARRLAARRTSAAAARLAARRLARHVLRQWWERTIAAAATAWAARLHAARAAARRRLAAWVEAIATRQSARFWQWHAARQHHLLASRRATRRRAAAFLRLAAAAADRSDARTARLLARAHHRLAASRRAWRALRQLRRLAPSRLLHARATLRGWQPEVRGWRAWREACRRAELAAAASVGAGGAKEAALLAALHARRAALLRGMCAWVGRRRREGGARAPAALRRAVRAWRRRLPRLAAAEARHARVRLLVRRRRREGISAALARLRLAAEREGREGRAAAWRRRVHTGRALRRWRRHAARERRLLSLLKPSVSIRPILCGVREQRMFDALRRGFGRWFLSWRRRRLDAIAEARAARRWERRQIRRAQIAWQTLAAWALTQRLSKRARDWETRRRKRYGWGQMVRRCRVWAVCSAMMGLVLRPMRKVRPGVVGHAKRVDSNGSSLSSFVPCTRLSPLAISARLPLSRVYELILRWRHQHDRARRLAGWLARQHRKALICVLYRWLENQDWRRMKRRRRKKTNLRDLIWM